MTTTVLQALRRAVGEGHVLNTGDLSAWEQDWRKRWHGKALAVVRPANSAELAQVVRICAAHGVAIVPQGGNTGLVGGGVPDSSATQVLLSLGRMNQVRHIDRANLTMTVDAGCVLQNLQTAAAQADLLFPLSLASQGSCTIGGNLATNAGGTQVLRYGNARELCLGLEVVTAQGEIWDGLSGLRKDNTGYDLRNLFIGSEGTLGVITGATLKLYPRPVAEVTSLATCATLGDCVALLGLVQASLGAGLTGFEVMNTLSLALVQKHFAQLAQPLAAAPWTVLMESVAADDATALRERVESTLQAALETGLIDNAVVAESLAQAAALWQLRESIPLAQALQGTNIKHDIALPVSAIADFVARTDAALQLAYPGVQLVNFGHLGDGNLHYNVQCSPGADAAEFLAHHEHTVNAIVYDAVQACGGSFSAEHGVGTLKLDEMLQHKSPVALGMMRAIKHALDPRGVMNPGRVLPLEPTPGRS